MSAESKDFDAYALVLADLKAQRDRIDQAIQAIEAIRGGASAQNQPAMHTNAPTQGGEFLGMSIADAAKKLLAMRRKPMNNTSILAELRSGGLVLTAADPLNTVGAVLSRRFHEVGDIVRVERGTWGLKEWYPNRSFARTPRGNGDNAQSDEK